jgi:hypothetical protein
MKEASPLGERRSSNTRSAQRRKGTSLQARSSRSTPIKADSRRVSRKPTLVRGSPRTEVISLPAKGREFASGGVLDGCRHSGSGTYWPANANVGRPSARRARRRDRVDWLRSRRAGRTGAIHDYERIGRLKRIEMKAHEEHAAAEGPEATASQVPGPDEEGPDAMTSRVTGPDKEGSDAMASRVPGPDEEGPEAMASQVPGPDEEGPEAMASSVPGPDEEGPEAMASRVTGPDEEGPDAMASRVPGSDKEGPDAMASRAQDSRR